jgi:hypothetical protein
MAELLLSAIINSMRHEPRASRLRKGVQRTHPNGPLTAEYKAELEEQRAEDSKELRELKKDELSKRQTRFSAATGLIGILLGVANATWIAGKYWIDSSTQFEQAAKLAALTRKRAFFLGDSLAREVNSVNVLYKFAYSKPAEKPTTDERYAAVVERYEQFAVCSSLEESLGIKLDLKKVLDENVYEFPPQIDYDSVPRSFFFIFDEQFDAKTKETFDLAYRLSSAKLKLEALSDNSRSFRPDLFRQELDELDNLLPRLAKEFGLDTGVLTNEIADARKLPYAKLISKDAENMWLEVSELLYQLEDKMNSDYERFNTLVPLSGQVSDALSKG